MCSLINKQLLLTAYAYLFITEQQKGLQGSEALQLESGAVELCPCFQNNLGEIQSFSTDLFAEVKGLLNEDVAVVTLGHLNDARERFWKHYDLSAFNTNLGPRIESFLRQRKQHIKRTNCLENNFHEKLDELDKMTGKATGKARQAAPDDMQMKMSKLAELVAPRKALEEGDYLGISAATADMQTTSQGVAKDSTILQRLIDEVGELQTKVRFAVPEAVNPDY